MKRQILIVFIFFIIYFSTPNHYQFSVEAIGDANGDDIGAMSATGSLSELGGPSDDIDDNNSNSGSKLDQEINYLDDANDMRKRSWKNLQSSWGKRRLNYLIVSGGIPSPSSSIDEYNGDGNNGKQMEKYLLNDLFDAIDLEHLNPSDNYNGENGLIQQHKRAWKAMNGAWGKRVHGGSDWNKFRGSWGKREPGWNNLKGLWGKRGDWNKLSSAWGKRSTN